MAKRRPAGDGMVRKREDGRWEGRIVIGHRENGEPLFRHVYASDIAVAEHKKAEKIVGDLFDYYLEYPEEMSGEFQALLDDGDPVRQVVCDYIACMTDRFAVAKYKTLFIPQEWTIL